MRSVVTRTFVVACVFGVAVGGCTVKSTDTDVPYQNTTGDAGGRGGAAGVAVDGGDDGAAGAAGDDGGALEAGDSDAEEEVDGGDVDASDPDADDRGDAAACLDDSFTAFPDCSALPYAGQACDDGQGGSFEPWGIELCGQAASAARSGVFESLYPCLAELDDPCDDDAVIGCVDDTFPRACTTTQAESDCAAIAQSCPADADGGGTFDESMCVAYMSALRAASGAIVKECVDQTLAEAGEHDCGAVFSDCISDF